MCDIKGDASLPSTGPEAKHGVHGICDLQQKFLHFPVGRLPVAPSGAFENALVSDHLLFCDSKSNVAVL